MKDPFDPQEAKKFLLEKEKQEKEKNEEIRKEVLQKAVSLLKQEFQGSPVEVYLVGSILKPFQFTSRSDIDVVLKNYAGDRLDFWVKFEKAIERDVEVILFETCHFKTFIENEGLKVV